VSLKASACKYLNFPFQMYLFFFMEIFFVMNKISMEFLDILTFTFLILLVNLNKQSICVSIFRGKNRSNFFLKKFRLPIKILNKQSVC
jgi:hypothetical protein